jgi:hypothetical protein
MRRRLLMINKNSSTRHPEFLPRRGFVPVGAGEVWSGVGTLASPPQEGECTRNQDEGDASVPTHRICHPRPYGYEVRIVICQQVS